MSNIGDSRLTQNPNVTDLSTSLATWREPLELLVDGPLNKVDDVEEHGVVDLRKITFQISHQKYHSHNLMCFTKPRRWSGWRRTSGRPPLPCRRWAGFWGGSRTVGPGRWPVQKHYLSVLQVKFGIQPCYTADAGCCEFQLWQKSDIVTILPNTY